MRFGILTFFDVINYGAALQAFALQNTISDLGHDSEFIRIDDSRGTKSADKKGIRLYYQVLKSNNFSLKTYKLASGAERKKKELFFEFCERYMIQSRKKYYDIEQLKKDQESYHGFIAGSDMVWSDIGQNLDIYFMNFAPECKRLSYAPSLTGRDGESTEMRAKYKKWLEGISSLSCREQYGVDYISKLTGRTPKLVVDPTLLLDKKKWVSALNLEKKENKKYILCYLFRGTTPVIRKKLKLYVKKYNMDVRFIPMSSDENIHNNKYGFENSIGPKEFVELFYNASYVFTNSFHGLLFSLIMNKPFYVFHRGEGNEWKKHEERMDNILNLVRLENRFIFEHDLHSDLDFDIDFKKINEYVSLLRNESLSYLSNTLNSVSENSVTSHTLLFHRIDDLEEKMCTGCAVCSNVCPKDAIKMIESEEGFFYPHINEEECVNCGICANKCQALASVELAYPIKTFCGVGKNELVKRSASGGAFVTFSKYIIEHFEGVVFGAALILPEGICKHISVDAVKDLYQLQNSKYVQSDISDALRECKAQLQNGRTVLFSGTPCQIGALKKYLGKEYAKLITIDIICHGVPSPKFFKEYKKNEIPSDVTELYFRHRVEAEKRRSAFDINYIKNGKMVIKPGTKDLFYAPFINAESYRECCYYCQFAREERCSDITIGDCDSYFHYQGLESNNIISSIIINTKKGINMWELCKECFTYAAMDYKEECIVNHQLRRPVSRPNRRDTIYKEITEGWSQYKKKNEKRDGMENKIKRIILRLFR